LNIEKFKYDPKVEVFLVSFFAGGAGLNLQEATFGFLLDQWWNPAKENQAKDRIYRMDSYKLHPDVFFYRFYANDSVDSSVERIKNRKQEIYAQVFSTVN